MPPIIQTILKVAITILAMVGLVLLFIGWHENARDAPPILSILIAGILFTTLGIRFPGLTGYSSEKKEEKKQDDKSTDTD